MSVTNISRNGKILTCHKYNVPYFGVDFFFFHFSSTFSTLLQEGEEEIEVEDDDPEAEEENEDDEEENEDEGEDEDDGEDIRMNVGSDGECDELDDLPSSRGNQWKGPISRKPSQTSVYLQEWDIPFEQLDLGELIGKVRNLTETYMYRINKNTFAEVVCSRRAAGAKSTRVGGTVRSLSDFLRSMGTIRTI